MGYKLNSTKGAIKGIIWGSIIGVIKADTRSLDYSSYGAHIGRLPQVNPKRSEGAAAQEPSSNVSMSLGLRSKAWLRMDPESLGYAAFIEILHARPDFFMFPILCP